MTSQKAFKARVRARKAYWRDRLADLKRLLEAPPAG
ncbi:hypothetical protein DFJ69_1935 [Thermomonospora umbrina]|uniref:Uncharacterized protein n=1 Tax=Thermomonospora umbrina TaxID=111806 RepID=A0A3D9SKW2_9ACTN|nr:hypothetical protein DFJ69_1935 [Thermomonospora umbrina]